MIKKSNHLLNKKPVKSKSSKLGCPTNNEVISKQPCVMCSNCSRTISSTNDIGKNLKNTSIMKNIKYVNLDQSIDLVPTKLCQNKQATSDSGKVSARNELGKGSTKYVAPAVKKTTWDCILREQNIDFMSNEPISKIKSVPNHKTVINKSVEEKKKVGSMSRDHPNEHIFAGKEAKCNYSNNLQEPVYISRYTPNTVAVDYNNSVGIGYKSQLHDINLIRRVKLIDPTSTNPILTLDLLVKELRGKLQRQAIDEDLQRIILDMENALTNFPSVTARDQDCYDGIPHPEEFKKSIQKKFDIAQCKSLEQLHVKLEENCHFLQDVYNQLHKESKRHKEEKDKLTQNLTECRRLLAISKSKERESEEIIKALRLGIQDKSKKVDHDGQAIHELTQIISRLQEENKDVTSLRAANSKLHDKYNKVIVEKETLNSKLQLALIEKEKLLALMQVKDNEIRKMQNNLEDIKSIFGKHLENVKGDKEVETFNLDSTISSNWDRESDERFRPICSSPTSSIPGSSPSPYSSWQVISSIPQKPKATLELKQGILDLFAEMKKTTKELNPNKLMPMPELDGASGISDSNDEDALEFKSVPKLSNPFDIVDSDLSS